MRPGRLLIVFRLVLTRSQTARRVPTAGLFSLQTAIAAGIANAVPPVNFYCPPPATRCTWPSFSTLAVCSNFTNLTNIIKPDCATDDDGVIKCNYRFPQGANISFVSNTTTGEGSILNSTGALSTSNGVFGLRLDGIRILYTGDVLYAVDRHDPQSFRMEWNYCIKTYSELVASPTGVHTVEYTPIPLLPNDTIPAGILRWNSFSNPSSNIIFNLTSSVQTGLWQQLSDLLSRELFEHFTGDGLTTDFSIGEYMLYADLANMTRNIEETLSNQIRSSSPGDNGWAGMWPGEAFYEEAYWKVNWPWIVLPVTEVVFAALLLAISIIVTRTQPLFKSSILALLYHGLEDIDKDVRLRGNWENNVDELEEITRHINVELKMDSNGSLKFIRSEQNSN